MDADQVFVVKVKFGGTLRRFAFKKSFQSPPTFLAVEKQIRSRFSIDPSQQMCITYQDTEKDVIYMSTDEDVRDALIYQKLNPLRLDVTLVVENKEAKTKTLSPPIEKTEEGTSFDASPTSGSSSSEKQSTPLAEHSQTLSELAKAIEDQLKLVLGTESPSSMSSLVKKYEPVIKHAPVKIAEMLQLLSLAGLKPTIQPILEKDGVFVTGSEVGFQASDCEHSVSSGTPSTTPADLNQALPVHERVTCDICYVNPIRGKRFKSQVKPDYDLCQACFDKHGVKENFDLVETPLTFNQTLPSVGASAKIPDEALSPAVSEDPAVPPQVTGGACLRPSTTADSVVVHPFITCDICGINPIQGVRFKSIVKPDYDLCGTCFRTHGVVGEYNRIETPLFRPPHLWAQRGCPARNIHGSSFGGRPFNAARPCYHRMPHDMRLDARFVRDVTIYDGTEMAPSTCFTKIWCLRNSGVIAWPCGSRIVFTGGDKLGPVESVDLPIGEDGLKPQDEVEVSVDMVAPSRPGRYVSNWRLVAPGGPKFGHKLWATIQVVLSGDPSPMIAESLGGAIAAPLAGDELSVPAVAEDALPAAIATPKEETAAPHVAVEVADEIPAEQQPEVVNEGVMSVDPSSSSTQVLSKSSSKDPLVEALAASRAAAEAAGVVMEKIASHGVATAPSTNNDATVSVTEVSSVTTDVPLPQKGTSSDVIDGAVESLVKKAVETSSPVDTSSKVEDTAVGGFSLLDIPSAKSSPSRPSTASSSSPIPPPTSFSVGKPISILANRTSATNGSGSAGVNVVDDFSSLVVESMKGFADYPSATKGKEQVPLDIDWENRMDVEDLEDDEVEEETGHLGGVGVKVKPSAPPAVEDGKSSSVDALDLLEGMGFEGRGFNLFVLESCKGDLQATLDILVKTHEWKDVLDNLAEMGFDDLNLNKKLMLKHDGKMTAVVKDLVKATKA